MERVVGGKNNDLVFAYPLNGSLYLNITNRCPNACLFCIRNSVDGVGYNLWLEREPMAGEILAAVGHLKGIREIVFCGYGEPLLRPEVIIEVATALKERIRSEQLDIGIRINTNGLADLFLGYDVLPQLKGLIDAISISLNAHNSEAYLKITQSPYGEKAFPAVLDFVRRSTFYIPKVVLSVVRYPGVDIGEATKITRDLGVELRIREHLE